MVLLKEQFFKTHRKVCTTDHNHSPLHLKGKSADYETLIRSDQAKRHCFGNEALKKWQPSEVSNVKLKIFRRNT
jgi:hypothetical protein